MNDIERLSDALRRAKRSHYSCEDCFYSCPLAEDSCVASWHKGECDCGADEFNARVDAVLAGEEWSK